MTLSKVETRGGVWRAESRVLKVIVQASCLIEAGVRNDGSKQRLASRRIDSERSIHVIMESVGSWSKIQKRRLMANVVYIDFMAGVELSVKSIFGFLCDDSRFIFNDNRSSFIRWGLDETELPDTSKRIEQRVHVLRLREKERRKIKDKQSRRRGQTSSQRGEFYLVGTDRRRRRICRTAILI